MTSSARAPQWSLGHQSLLISLRLLRKATNSPWKQKYWKNWWRNSHVPRIWMPICLSAHVWTLKVKPLGGQKSHTNVQLHIYGYWIITHIFCFPVWNCGSVAKKLKAADVQLQTVQNCMQRAVFAAGKATQQLNEFWRQIVPEVQTETPKGLLKDICQTLSDLACFLGHGAYVQRYSLFNSSDIPLRRNC